MSKLRIRRPSPSLVVASLALLVALSGTSYATVLNVPRSSVGTPELKRNAVKASKIAPNAVRAAHVLNGSLLAVDFKSGQLPRGEKGDKGEKGEKGDRGPTGPVGISGYEIVRASTIAPPNSRSTAQAHCPSGKKVIGGAGAAQGLPSGVFIHTNLTLTEFYDAHAVNTTAVSQQVNAVAICANVAE